MAANHNSNTLDNSEKARLIEMVQENSILWDSRLSTFKGADNQKLAGWTDIGKEFELSPQKAERSFNRLREIFRKELMKHRRLGDAFHSDWEFYDAISFLRPIIKERKSGLQRDLKIPIEDYAYYIGHDHGNRRNSSAAELVTPMPMTEIPVETEITPNQFFDFETIPKLETKPLKRGCSSEGESSSSCSKMSRSDLHEKFGNLVTSKLNTLDDVEAENQMKNIVQLLFH